MSSLIKIDHEIVTSDVSSVELTGITSEFNVYQVLMRNVTPETDGTSHFIRVTVGGTPDTSANYDRSVDFLVATGSSTLGNVNQTAWQNLTPTNTANTGGKNMMLYLYNFHSSSNYSYCTVQEVGTTTTGVLAGNMGAGVHTVNQSCDGISIYFNGCATSTGEFIMYGLKK